MLRVEPLLVVQNKDVVYGRYEDDRDEGEWFLYTGSGGRDLSGNKRTNKVGKSSAWQHLLLSDRHTSYLSAATHQACYQTGWCMLCFIFIIFCRTVES